MEESISQREARSIKVDDFEKELCKKTKLHYDGLIELSKELNPTRLQLHQFNIDAAIVMFETVKGKEICVNAFEAESPYSTLDC